MAKKYVPDFEYTSIQINKNFAGALHVDRGNVGPSTMLTVGTDMNGGDLYIHGVGTVKTQNKFLPFPRIFPEEQRGIFRENPGKISPSNGVHKGSRGFL